MNEYLQLKAKICRKVESLEESIKDLESFRLADGALLSRWADHLEQVRASLEDSLLRIAVVGAVKSGKSTLINTILGRDILKRGAGIITAFITRIQSAEELGGWVELKGWSQVREEIDTAMAMLPFSLESAPGGMDIRLARERERLQERLERVSVEWQKEGGNPDPNFILLHCYLSGYKGVSPLMAETENRILFDENSILQHQDYVGNEGQSVYIRDMELHCPVPWLGSRVEIADCQGSDSPNPLHFALLQQYLMKCHFILYVISSRAGLRQADFKLLEFIKTLRMFPQTFFILNADFDVHPHGDDLDNLISRVRKELNWLVPHPQLFTFSSLYHLMEELGDGLSARQKRHLDIWREDEALVRLTESGFSSFREELSRKIAGQRARILLGASLGRLVLVARSARDIALARRSLMAQDIARLVEASGKLKARQKALQGTLSTLRNAITGLKDSLRLELEESVDEYFDLDKGSIVKGILDMVEHYPIDPRYERDLSDYRQLPNRLYRFYTEFRESVSRFVIERVNLQIIEFAKEREAFLQDRLAGSSQAFWSVFAAALEDYRRELSQFGVDLHPTGEAEECQWPSVEGVPPPPFSAFLDRDAVRPGILMVKFGIGRLTRFLSGLKTRIGATRDFLYWESQRHDTIEEAVSLVKAEAKSEIVQAFKRYRKSFKCDYLQKILEAKGDRLWEEFKDRAEMAQLDFADMLRRSEEAGEGRESMMETVARIDQRIQAMIEELDSLRCAVNLEWLPRGEGANLPVKGQSE